MVSNSSLTINIQTCNISKYSNVLTNPPPLQPIAWDMHLPFYALQGEMYCGIFKGVGTLSLLVSADSSFFCADELFSMLSIAHTNLSRTEFVRIRLFHTNSDLQGISRYTEGSPRSGHVISKIHVFPVKIFANKLCISFNF